MKRNISILMLVAMIAAYVSSFGTVAAAEQNTQVQNVFLVDFADGKFVGALVHTDGDSVKAIKLSAADGETFEDFFPSNANTITVTHDLISGMMTAYSSEYDKMIALNVEYITDSAHIVGYCTAAQSYTACQLDGDNIQAHGFIQNGEIIKLRGADAYSVNRGLGYLVQNGNLISYAIENGEDAPVKKIYMALIAR